MSYTSSGFKFQVTYQAGNVSMMMAPTGLGIVVGSGNRMDCSPRLPWLNSPLHSVQIHWKYGRFQKNGRYASGIFRQRCRQHEVLMVSVGESVVERKVWLCLGVRIVCSTTMKTSLTLDERKMRELSAVAVFLKYMILVEWDVVLLSMCPMKACLCHAP
jgi:hypothetical protein